RGAGAVQRAGGGRRAPARRRAARSRPHESARAAAGAVPRARGREHAGGARRAGLPHQHAAGAAAPRRRPPERARPGAGRRHRPVSRRRRRRDAMNRSLALRAGVVALAAIAAWILFFGLPKWSTARRAEPVATPSTAAPAPPPGAAGRKITATPLYVSPHPIPP